MKKEKSRAKASCRIYINPRQLARLDAIKSEMRAFSNGKFKATVADAFDQIIRQADEPHIFRNLPAHEMSSIAAILIRDGMPNDEAMQFLKNLKRAHALSRQVPQ